MEEDSSMTLVTTHNQPVTLHPISSDLLSSGRICSAFPLIGFSKLDSFHRAGRLVVPFNPFIIDKKQQTPNEYRNVKATSSRGRAFDEEISELMSLDYFSSCQFLQDLDEFDNTQSLLLIKKSCSPILPLSTLLLY